MKEFREKIELIEYLSGVKLSAYDKFNLILRIIFNL